MGGVRSEIYVDKTGLIACTNQYLGTKQKYICVSRPRRFGKSIALKMLAHTPALVVELKHDKSAAAALRQIGERHYTQVLEGYAGEILLAGINYERGKADKPHSCEIGKLDI